MIAHPPNVAVRRCIDAVQIAQTFLANGAEAHSPGTL